MANESFGRLFLGKWNTKTLVSIAVGAALYGVLMVYGSIPVFTNTNLTTAMIIPVVVGGLFGPVPTFVTLLLGNCIADLIGGWGFWIDWSIGTGVLGLFIGALPLYGARISEGVFKVRHAIIYGVAVVVGNAFALGIVTPLLTMVIQGSELEITFLQSLAASISNIAVLIIIGIPLLVVLSRRFGKRANLTEEA
jgi:energy-coupling factor transport system substrate-specific component